MKWFKHMADASNDEALADLIDEFGLEGYGRWWLLIETIALQMDKSNKCSVEYSWVKWQALLKGKRNKLRLFLERLENYGKIKLKENGNKLEIKCPKLLELRDNHSKNLQARANRTNNQDCKQEVEVEVEVDTPLNNINLTNGEFGMFHGWEVSHDYLDVLRILDIPTGYPNPKYQKRFIAWWTENGATATQRQWEQRLIEQAQQQGEWISTAPKLALVDQPAVIEEAEAL